mmetsp:Transcript_43725/g.138204  ORF Transcript_43725/g.138204 Transcript_43725/m.138204 type:complete len:469 (-) Transcript_43725:1230-2636(-)
MSCRRLLFGILGIWVGCSTSEVLAFRAHHAVARSYASRGSPACRLNAKKTPEHATVPTATLFHMRSIVGSDSSSMGSAVSLEKAAMLLFATVSFFLGQPTISHAEFSQEQALAADVWSVVDATFVDRTFNNHDWMKLRQNVVKREYSDRQQVYDAISKDLLEPLGDKYTRFIDPVKFEALKNSIVGKGQDVSGIGVTLSLDKQNKLVKIVDVLDASPAAEAGLKRGSLVVQVNGIPTDDGKSTPDDVAALLRGPTATKAKLKLRLPGSQEETEVTLERRKVAVKPVTGGMNGKTSYIKIKQFDTQTAELVKDVMQKNLAAGATCHVLDLRDNAGGYFRAGVDTAALFLPAGKPIVYVVNKDGLQDSFSSSADGLDTRNPLFLLVNGNTASASEIVTGALKDLGRAKVLGEKTFGKGVVQTVTPLFDGSAVASTIARYETPNHEDINKKGIEVDGTEKDLACPDPYPNL